MPRVLLLTCLVLSLCLSCQAATYYVDFASGSDADNGLKASTAWKHAPGDPQATDQPARARLQPGDVVQFKGGVVYRGSITLNAGGEAGARLVYQGTGWGAGRAIIDGSDLITGWRACRSAADAGGNLNFRQLFTTEVPAERSPFLINLHEIDAETGEDRTLYLSQTPNPEDFFFFNRRDGLHPVKHENMALDAITAPDFFTQPDADHWQGASLLIWVNPNWTVRKEIKAYDPAEGKVTLDSPLKKNAIYPDGRDQGIAIYNSPHAIDFPGEYAVLPPDDEGVRKVILWPHNPQGLDQRISGSVRTVGIRTGPHSHVEIAGFEIRKFGSESLREGSGIIAYAGQHTIRTDTVIRDNLIHSNKHGTKGYGGIYVHRLKDSLIEANTVTKNPLHAGIFLSDCEDSIVRENTIQYTGNTALRLYTCRRMQVLNNTISHIYSTHANGLTLYLGCYDVLVANNFIVKATTPITHQSSGNLYFINNVTDGQDEYKNVNEWPLPKGKTMTSGRVVYLNNTFVHAGGDASLNLGRDDNNEYIVINNILDGLSFSTKNNPKLVLHEYNLFVGRNYTQSAKYGWADGEGERFTQAPLDTIFVDPKAMDFRLKPGSPAVGAGIDVTRFYPSDVFPDFDFRTGITGAPRKDWSLGAYAN